MHIDVESNWLSYAVTWDMTGVADVFVKLIIYLFFSWEEQQSGSK